MAPRAVLEWAKIEASPVDLEELPMRNLCAFAVLVTFVPAWALANEDAAPADARTILQSAGLTGGFVVHLGANDGKLTSALRQNESIQVHGLVRDPADVPIARANVQRAGGYGPVAIDLWQTPHLPYVDNLVNLIVVEELGETTRDEIQRVLAPNGVAMIREASGEWTKTVKSRPDNIDEWSHYLHDASGNSVAHDEVVAPPRHLQWVGSPRWSRHHDRMASMSALVSTNGRMFYIMDEGSRISIQMPPKWKLIARDAFNGTILWKRDIKNWQSHLWPLKSGPTQLSRRLVSTQDTVYTTLAFDAPMVAIDAASGETQHSFEGSESTEEIITTGGLIFVVSRKGKAELADYAPLHGRVGDQARVRDFFWNEEPRVVIAYNAATGEKLWAKQTTVSPLTLAADGSRLFFHNGEKLVAVDQKTGEMAWETEPVTRRNQFTFNFGPRLVVYEDVVLYAGGDGKMLSVSADKGSTLWEAEHPRSGYQSPQDLMVADGLVWVAPLTSGGDTGEYTGRDPRTGEVKKQFSPNVDTYWFHHRCYIAKATDNFLMPSRTGIEFVDPDSENWDIHHWVRGGCLYGVMPCNGLTYAPPHNCACYPEAKLFGFNALAPAAPSRPVPKHVPEAGRLEKGPAYLATLSNSADSADDWPTFRHDLARTGQASSAISAQVKPHWSAELGGRVTAPVIAGGTVYVAQTDYHTLYALSEFDGSTKWTYTIGARIDSPPTIAKGRVVFGGADGWVYCLTTNGDLAWRYRAAPIDRRTMAYEQLESLWPVHGSVLIRDDVVFCVAGRSNFIDGGLRLLRLDLASGKKLSETVMDETNPETGNNLQEKLQILQMPVGLPDILSANDENLFMKSQKFTFFGERLEIGPNSGDFVGQVTKQRGKSAHIFAPMGFLDDSWFHRSYWVLGQSFAGGHGGYYQAGRFAPSGRLLVQGDGYVYGYGRKPEYLRWTTTLEHQLFAADPNPPEIPEGFNKKNSRGGSFAQFPKSPSVDPTGKPVTIEAWFTATKPNGVIAARGGPAQGFALSLAKGRPVFDVRSDSRLGSVSGKRRLVGGWHHVVGVLGEDKSMRLFVDGKLAGEGEAPGLITSDPAQSLEIGGDAGSAVGKYTSPHTLTGIVDEFRLYFAEASSERIKDRFENDNELMEHPAMVVTFDDGSARDLSLNRLNGTIVGGKLAKGRHGRGIQFTGVQRNAKNQRQGNSLVDPKWKQDIPVYVRAMVLAKNKLFVVGPADVIDEEATFQKLTEKDASVEQLLAHQDDILNGKEGSRLLTVNIDSGDIEHSLELDTLPAWDGMAGANGRLYLSTRDGQVVCLGE